MVTTCEKAFLFVPQYIYGAIQLNKSIMQPDDSGHYSQCTSGEGDHDDTKDFCASVIASRPEMR